tara:strand:+ start:179 stop:481 length:303 start_codon:yes stop_codon:yes gene_type:complete
MPKFNTVEPPIIQKKKELKDKIKLFTDLFEAFQDDHCLPLEEYVEEGWDEERFKVEFGNIFRLVDDINRIKARILIKKKEIELYNIQQCINSLKERFNPK